MNLGPGLDCNSSSAKCFCLASLNAGDEVIKRVFGNLLLSAQDHSGVLAAHCAALCSVTFASSCQEVSWEMWQISEWIRLGRIHKYNTYTTDWLRSVEEDQREGFHLRVNGNLSSNLHIFVFPVEFNKMELEVRAHLFPNLLASRPLKWSSAVFSFGRLIYLDHFLNVWGGSWLRTISHINTFCRSWAQSPKTSYISHNSTNQLASSVHLCLVIAHFSITSPEFGTKVCSRFYHQGRSSVFGRSS